MLGCDFVLYGMFLIVGTIHIIAYYKSSNNSTISSPDDGVDCQGDVDEES